MAYTKTVWVNDSAPFLTDTNLNKIEQGIADAQAVTDVFSSMAVSVVDADTTGATDATIAIQTALDAGAGGVVWIPPGLYTISAKITVPKGTLFLGPGSCDYFRPLLSGAVLQVTHTSDIAVSLARGAIFDGINMYWPNQVTTSSPVVYDWAIKLDNSDTAVSGGSNAGCVIRNAMLINAYNGIDLGGDNTDSSPVHGSELIDNVKMYAINTGIRSAATFVEWNLRNFTFSPQFWQDSVGTAIRQYAMTNGNAAIEIVGAQGFQSANVTLFGHARGIYVHSTTGIGTVNKAITFFKVSNSIIDGCRTCIEVSGDVGISGGTITGNTLASNDAYNTGFDTGKCIYLNDSQQPNNLVISGNEFSGTSGSHVVIEAPTSTAFNKIAVTGNNMLNANRLNAAGTFYNISADDTRLSLVVSGNVIANANDSTVTNFNIANARNLVVTGNTCLDNASTPIVVGTISTRNLIANNAWEGVVGGTYTSMASTAVASAATLTLPATDQPVFVVTGTTGITTITPSWRDRIVTLRFNGSLTVTDGSNLVLAGNFTTTANDTLTLTCDGTNWYEIGRSVN